MNTSMHVVSGLLWRFWDEIVSPSGWRSVVGPVAFVAAAVALLIYNHVNERVSDLLFWLTLALIVTVFARMIETNRRQSRELVERRRGALVDEATALPNRRRLEADIAAAGAAAGNGDPGQRRVLALLELEGLQAYGAHLGYAAGDDLLRLAAARLVGAIEPLGGTVYRFDTERLAALSPDGGRLGELLLASTDALQEDGGGPPIARSYGEATLPDEAADAEMAFQLAGQRLESHKQRQHRSARRQAHAVLMAALGARRPELREQLRVVAYRSISLARRLGLSMAEIDDIALAAELKEIGLLAAPEHAQGNGSHAAEGEAIVAAAPGLATVARIVRSGAERFDGSGRPDGLAGEEIPVGARIVAVAAAFSALTAPRSKQPPMGPGEALDELGRRAGSQFDPAVVAALVRDLADETAPGRTPLPAA